MRGTAPEVARISAAEVFDSLEQRLALRWLAGRAGAARIIDGVQSGGLTLGVVGAELDVPELEFEPLLEDQLVFLAAPGFRSGMDGRLGTKEICTWPWIMRERGSGTRKALERALVAAGLDERCLNIALTVDTTEAVLQCVMAGLGIGVTSRLAAGYHLERGALVALEMPSLPVQRRFFLVRHARRHVFPATSHFIDFLREACKGMTRPAHG